jgi:hypothetical protein
VATAKARAGRAAKRARTIARMVARNVQSSVPIANMPTVHFPAMEVPGLLAGDVRAFFRSLR